MGEQLQARAELLHQALEDISAGEGDIRLEELTDDELAELDIALRLARLGVPSEAFVATLETEIVSILAEHPDE